MSKVSSYLNEHIQGEVTSNAAIRQAMSTDASMLTITPEMVVYPRVTNDIRKTARFSNQLAEKGHVLPITARGGGSDQTGAAIGKGIILNTMAHMDTIFELDSKQRLVRVQPGVTFKALNEALALHGMYIPCAPASAGYSTVGGAIANNASGVYSGKYGSMANYVKQLEVVLSNGDIIQTGRISKRELNRKKGQQTFEGEIYRQIDNLIADNVELVASLPGKDDVRDSVGYNIADVKHKDGSIDLAPLIIGSQGTLGVVSEVILQAELLLPGMAIAALAFENWNAARDAIDVVTGLGPCMVDLFDARLFDEALVTGKKFDFYTEATEQGKVAAVLVVAFDDASDRHRNKKFKKLRKFIKQESIFAVGATEGDDISTLLHLRDVTTTMLSPETAGHSTPPLVDGAYISPDRLEDFIVAVGELAKKFHLDLPLYGHVLDGTYYVRPKLQLARVGDKQKVFKFTDEYALLVASHGGNLIGEAGEGRFKALFAYKNFDDDIKELYDGVKKAFDPLGVMNPGVKQEQSAKALVQQLRKEYDFSAFAGYAPSL